MSVAAPPTNGQVTPPGPPVIEQPATHGPGPPDLPPAVAPQRPNRRGWIIGLGVAMLVGVGIGAVVISSSGSRGVANGNSPAVPVAPTNGFHNANTLDAAMLTERNSILSNGGSSITATSYSCLATNAGNTTFSCNSTFSDGSTGSTTATVNAAGDNWISANETIVPGTAPATSSGDSVDSNGNPCNDSPSSPLPACL